MKKLATSAGAAAVSVPLRLTAMAALMASLCAPALAADVVISQVYGGGGNSGATYKNDFVELFNRSAAPVSLAGWSVQYSSAAGTAWQVTTLPGVTLQPGQYMLVQEAVGAGGSVALPAPDAIGTLALSATAGKVALSNSTVALSGANPSGGALQDLVGFGTTATGYETSPAPGPSNTLSVLRNDYGCTDTNDNATDFVTGAPAPRNTASTPRVCGTPVQLPITASCPASLTLAAGSAAGAALTATDPDSIVNGVSITSTPVPGISLINFAPAGAAGGTASVSLNVTGSVAIGTYPVTVGFVNDGGQSASCAITVNVQPLAAVTHTIPQIQGSGATSPYAGTVQTTEGVLTLKVPGGFFMQDANGDGDPTTSDGIYVYTGSAINGSQPGDLVRVTGTVQEYVPSGATASVTELSSVTAVVSQSGGHTITPTIINMPNANLGRYAGMLVQFNQSLVVNDNAYLGSDGQLVLSSKRLEVPTNHYPSGSADEIAMAAANAIDQIVLDDGLFVTPPVVPYLDSNNTRRSGDTVFGLTGVVDFGSIGGGSVSYKIQPTVAPVFSSGNPRVDHPTAADGNLKVVSANIENFFTTFTDGTNAEGQTGQGCSLGNSVSKANCRGAANITEFQRKLVKVVDELTALNADAYALMEVQNDGETTITYLVNALNTALGEQVYAVVPMPPELGTDAIRVAMIYKPATLTLVGGAQSDGNVINNRAPMAQTFQLANGKKFSLIANHLRSKGSCPTGTGPDSDKGDGQGCWAATRVQQAQRLTSYLVPLVVAAAGDPDVLIVGDMNSNGFEDSINSITATGYVNEVERFERPNGMPYSYVFNGQASYLDHALASASLDSEVTGIYEWHINADEPSVLDYTLAGKPQDLYTPTVYRTSDHDPLLISLNLQPKYSDVTSSFRTTTAGLVLNRSTQKYSDTLTLTNISGSTLNGPFQLEFDGLTAGVTVANASGSHNGASYITVNATLAPGASVAVPLSFTDPAKTAIHYTNTVYNGSF